MIQERSEEQMHMVRHDNRRMKMHTAAVIEHDVSHCQITRDRRKYPSRGGRERDEVRSEIALIVRKVTPEHSSAGDHRANVPRYWMRRRILYLTWSRLSGGSAPAESRRYVFTPGALRPVRVVTR